MPRGLAGGVSEPARGTFYWIEAKSGRSFAEDGCIRPRAAAPPGRLSPRPRPATKDGIEVLPFQAVADLLAGSALKRLFLWMLLEAKSFFFHGVALADDLENEFDLIS